MYTSFISLAVSAFLVSAAIAAEDAAVQHVDAAGTQFPFVEAGDGKPVLFVHGALGDYRAWELLRDGVAEHYRFIAYTQRRFGTGNWPDEPGYTRAVHEADLVALLDAWGEPMHLVGWSYSGPIVLQAALDRPDLVRSVTVFEPTIATVLEGKPEHAEALKDWDDAWGPTVEASEQGANDEAARIAIEYVFGLPAGGFKTLPEAAQTMFLENAHTLPESFAAPPSTPMTCEDLRGIEAPVLILWGTNTLPFFEAAAKEVTTCLPDVKLEEIPSTGHGGPLQAPEAVLDKTLSFLRDTDG